MKKTSIKILCVILAVFLLIAAVFVIGMGILTAKGYGITEGRVLITAHGSYMLIDENNSPIEISNRSDKDIFQGLSSGDEILVLHDGIEESYPARTGAYYCKKLNDGKTEDIPASVIESLAELGWLEKEVNGTRVECIGENYKIALTIPENWEYEKTNGTIEFRPADKDGQIIFRFDDSFGVCGTGLESKTVYLGEHAGSMGTYDNSEKWSFIVLDMNYVILNQSGDWWSDYEAEVMDILSTIEYE